MRDSYRREHLEDVAPDAPNGATPKGEWIELIGSSYDRRIYGFEIPTTVEQDEQLIQDFNTRRNRGHFNLLFHNCADFSRSVIDRYYDPHAMRRNWIADAGITTPKQLVRSLERTSKERHIPLEVFVIPQVPGSIPRSIRVDGVLEAFLKRKYVLPVAVLHPIVAGSLAVVYLGDGRFNLPKDPPVLDVVALSHSAQEQAARETHSTWELTMSPTGALAPLVSYEPAQKTEAAEPPSRTKDKTVPVRMHAGG